MTALSSNLNILTDAVFPVLTFSSARRWVAFRDLCDETGDFPIAFDWPRADLNIASAELAIGLLGLVYRPGGARDWEAIWRGRSAVDVDAAIARLAPCFNLFGNAHGHGPRFCQELAPLAGEASAVEALFIDTPGVNGQKKNSDLMTHRGRFEALGLKAAAMALYALQQFAPSGGAGNRTSMRGGGPMTILLTPVTAGEPVPLWRMLLLNLAVQFGGDDAIEDDEIDRVLPWLKPTITSEGKSPRELASADPAVHPAQAFFGMPRRIRLVATGEGVCPLTGEAGPLVAGFVQKPWGMNYSVWSHPLTPYRQTKQEPRYSVKPKSSRFSYRDWVGVAVGWSKEADKAFPPAALDALPERRALLAAAGVSEFGLVAGGWAMNNMEAEAYLHAVQPLHLPVEGREDIVEALRNSANLYLFASDGAVRSLKAALNNALFGGQAKSTDSSLFEDATDTFFAATEQAFHAALAEIAEASAVPDAGAGALDWLATIRRAALAIFDQHATELLGASCDAKLATRVTGARGVLLGSLSEASKLAKDLGVPQAAKLAAKPAAKAVKG